MQTLLTIHFAAVAVSLWWCWDVARDILRRWNY